MEAICIINPGAGCRHDAHALAEMVCAVAKKHGWKSACVRTDAPGHATEIAREAAKHAELVIAAGGDGTVHEVAGALAGTQAALGIIPVGSGNGLARALGIPLDVEEAVQRLPMGTLRTLDVGKVNERLFFATAGCGLDAEIARRYNASRHARGIVPYIRHGIAAWFRRQPESVKITLGGQTIEERVLIFVAANTEQYGFGALIAPGAKPDDGKLLICRLAPVSTLRALVFLPRLFRGTLRRSSIFRATEASEVTVERARAGLIQVDGEPVEEDTTLHFSVLPGALRLWDTSPRVASAV